MNDWQPIETAPKSYSDAGRDRHYVLVVYPGWKEGKPDPFVLMAYQDSLGWDTGYWRLHETPTHWMPLPELPASANIPVLPAPIPSKDNPEAGKPDNGNGDLNA